VFGDVERHAEAAALGVLASCEDAVVRQLLDMLERPGAIRRAMATTRTRSCSRP
jgi:hypothetical protein